MIFNPSKNIEHLKAIFVKSPSGVYALKSDDALVEGLKTLPESIDLNFVDEQFHTILYFASINGRAHTVKYLLEERCINPNHTVKDNLTAFHGAALNGHLDVMDILASHGVNMAAVNIYGETALVKAINHLDGERLDATVDFIINKSPESIFIANEDGLPPIGFALLKKSPSVIKKFLDAGSDVSKHLLQLAGTMLMEQSKHESDKIHSFFRKTPQQENLYQSAMLIINAYNQKHLVEDLELMKAKVKFSCEPPPGSTIDEQGRTCVPSARM